MTGDGPFDLVVSNPPYIAHDEIAMLVDGVTVEYRRKDDSIGGAQVRVHGVGEQAGRRRPA